jgi:hypothetical protein
MVVGQNQNMGEKMNRNKYNANTSFLDFLFLLVLGFMCMFIISFLMIQVKTVKNAKVQSNAEFIITVTWPDDSLDDVDAYLADPLGKLVSFKRREDGLMHLDRDDLGRRNDVIQTPAGPVTFDENQEIITIRGIIPGEYIMNVHMYRKLEKEKPPTEVTVKIEKINPQVTLIALKKVELAFDGDEKTVLRFTLDEEGKVTSTNELQKELTKMKLEAGISSDIGQ